MIGKHLYLLKIHVAVLVGVPEAVELLPLGLDPVGLGLLAALAAVHVADVLLQADLAVAVLVDVLQGLLHHDVPHVVGLLGVEEVGELSLGQLAVLVLVRQVPPPPIAVLHLPTEQKQHGSEMGLKAFKSAFVLVAGVLVLELLLLAGLGLLVVEEAVDEVPVALPRELGGLLVLRKRTRSDFRTVMSNFVRTCLFVVLLPLPLDVLSDVTVLGVLDPGPHLVKGHLAVAVLQEKRALEDLRRCKDGRPSLPSP